MFERRRLTRWRINKRALLKFEQVVGRKESIGPSPANAVQQDVILPSPVKTIKQSSCQVTDINSVGAQVTLNTKLPQDTAFRISLRFSENYTILAKVWVTWHRIINGNNHYGLYFSEIKNADKEKISKFINSFYPNDGPTKMLQLGVVDTEIKKGGEEMNDHRIFERFQKEFSARFIGLDGKEGVAHTFDVSAKGLGLSTSQELESQSNLEIWLDVPNSTDPLYTRGQVVWSRLVAGEGFRSGIELERADLMGISRLLRS
jgi:PilZ domain